jgi:hypothetical protein
LKVQRVRRGIVLILTGIFVGAKLWIIAVSNRA